MKKMNLRGEVLWGTYRIRGLVFCRTHSGSFSSKGGEESVVGQIRAVQKIKIKYAPQFFRTLRPYSLPRDLRVLRPLDRWWQRRLSYGRFLLFLGWGGVVVGIRHRTLAGGGTPGGCRGYGRGPAAQATARGCGVR